MNTSRLRWYILLSVLFHLFVLWLLRFVPPTAPVAPSPVAIRILDTPSTPPPPAARKLPEPQPAPQRTPQPEPQPEPPKVVPPPPPPRKPGGVLAELPKPVQEDRPEDARIVSQYDSKAQDVGAGESAARKPSGENPREMPPELALPQRYSQFRPTPPQEVPTPPSPPAPTVVQPAPQLQARQVPPPKVEPRPEETRPPEASRRPEARRGKTLAPPAPTPELRRFRITEEEELAMVQREREREQQNTTQQQAIQEHFARLEKRQPLPTFDAPGVYERGPEQPGEGRGQEAGGKYRSIDSFGLKHFSYLVSVKRQIELLFSVPFFMPNNGAIGVPIVGFTIRRDGALAEAVLLRSSGYAILDRALLEAVKRAAPYGPFPQHLPDAEISIRVYATVS